MPFIVFEGLDGSGKTTLIRKLAEDLRERKLPVVVTREPGGSALGDEIREILLRTHAESPVPRAELLLYEAIRAQHVDKLLKPSLAKGHWILSDRYASSTLAFQAAGRNLPVKQIEWLNAFAVDECHPDLTILLDLPVEASAERRKTRTHHSGVEHDRFELEKNDFHSRVRESFLEQARNSPKKWEVLNALQTPEQIFQELVQILKARGWLAS